MQPFDLLKFSRTIPAARPLGYKQHALGIDIDCQDYWYAVHNDNTSTDTVIYLPSDLPALYYVMSLAWIREWFSFHRQLSSPRVYIWFWLHSEHHLKNGGTGQEGTQGRTIEKAAFWALKSMSDVSFELLRCGEMISNCIVTFVFCPTVFAIYRRQ